MGNGIQLSAGRHADKSACVGPKCLCSVMGKVCHPPLSHLSVLPSTTSRQPRSDSVLLARGLRCTRNRSQPAPAVREVTGPCRLQDGAQGMLCGSTGKTEGYTTSSPSSCLENFPLE